MESDDSEVYFFLKSKNKQRSKDIEMGNKSKKDVSYSINAGIVKTLFDKNKNIKKNNAEENKSKTKVKKFKKYVKKIVPSTDENFYKEQDEMKSNATIVDVTEINSETAIYNTELFKCVKKDLLKCAMCNLDTGASPNATCHLRRISICHMAAYYGSDQVLSLVLQRGANPFRRDYLGRTPLHFAGWSGSSACLLILLDHAFNDESERKEFIEAAEGEPDIPDPLWFDSPHLHNCVGTTFTVSEVINKQTALQLALSRLNLECARYLLGVGARICTCRVMANQDDAHFCPSTMDICGSALQEKDLTADERYLDAIKMLIEHGKKQTDSKRIICEGYYKPTGKKRTALHNTALLENGEATRLLLEVGFSSQQLDISDEAPIHYAVTHKKITPLQHLTEASDINDDILHSVLKLAIIKNWMAGVLIILKALKKMNGDISRKYKHANGNTALHYAARVGNQSIVNVLIETFRSQHLSIDIFNFSKYTPLHEAVIAGNASCVRVLLYQGASFELELHNGRNVLHEAAKRGYHDVLSEILETTKLYEKNAEFIGKKDNFGLSALHWASYTNSYKCFKLLFDADANLYTLGLEGIYHGFTVLHMAAINNSMNVVRMICRLNESMINSMDCDGLIPFHRAIINGHREASTFFLMKGANLSDMINTRGKKRSILEIISNDWRHPKKYLEELFDMQINKNEFSLDDPRCVVNLNYSLFIPQNRRMKIFEKMFGAELGFNQLLLHPLVESFLYMEWKRLMKFFFGIVAIYAFYSFFITCLVIDIYDDLQYSIVWEICSWINIVIIVLMECSLISESKSVRYLGELECVTKVVSMLLGLVLLLDCRAERNRDQEFSRAIASLTILTAWIQLGIQFSRLVGGFYYQMFTRVAARVAKVMVLFGWFPIVGFSLAFWVLFSGNTPFDTWMDSIVKTIVMMTSEFDYSSLFENKPFDPFWIITRIIFLAYIAGISIVLINLLMAIAISGTKHLKTEGKIQRLLQQVHFLGTLDGFAFNIVWMVLPRFISKHISKAEFSQLKLYPGRTGIWKYEYNNISDNLAAKLFKRLSEQISNQNESDDLESNVILRKEIIKECSQVFSIQINALNKRFDDITELLKSMRQ